MSVKPEGPLGDIKTLMFCIIQCKLPEGLLGDTKTLMFCIIQCKLKICISILIFTFYIINQKYLIIFDPNSLVILEKLNILYVTEVLEQPANESPVHNVLAIRE